MAKFAEVVPHPREGASRDEWVNISEGREHTRGVPSDVHISTRCFGRLCEEQRRLGSEPRRREGGDCRFEAGGRELYRQRQGLVDAKLSVPHREGLEVW